MKLKHIISRFSRDYYTTFYKQIQSVSCEEEDKWRLTARIGTKDYNDSRREYLLGVLRRFIYQNHKFVSGYKFSYESKLLGCKLEICVGSNYSDWSSYYRCKELKFRAWITKCDDDRLWNLIYKINWNRDLTIDLTGEDNVYSINQKIEARLSEYFYHHDSVFSRIQLAYSDKTKDDVKRTYKMLLQKQKDSRVNYCHDEVRRSIERRFNVEIWVDDLRRVGNVLAKDGIKYKEKKQIQRYDHSWIFEFDGDMDEIENEFYETIEDNVLYI